MSGTGALIQIPPSAVAAIANDITTIATSENARELCHYIASLAASAAQAVANANSPLFFHQQCNDVPYGATLSFSIGNVDDEVTVRCEGLVASFRKGETIPPQSVLVGVRGPNLIIVELGNSGGYNTSVTMNVTVSGVTHPGPLVTMHYEGNDPALTQRTRYFIFHFRIV